LDRNFKTLSEIGKYIARTLGIKLFPHHLKWLAEFENGWDRRVQLSPRGHGKTTIWGVIGIISLIIKNPNIRILLISKTEKLASRLLVQITRSIEQINKHSDIHLEVDKPHNKTELRVKGSKSKEPTLTATGVQGAVTGMHYDFILCDDILDEKNTQTREQREAVREWFMGSLLQLALPQTRILVLGTRKHPDDLYGEFLKNHAWDKSVERAIIRYPKNFRDAVENGKPINQFFEFSPEGKLLSVKKTGKWEVLWPEVWDIDRLLLDRHLSGGNLFDREKQNDVRNFSGNIFKETWIKHYHHTPAREELCVYMACDLAISQSENADSFCVAVVGINQEGNWFLLDLYAGKHTTLEQLSIIEEMHTRWKPTKLGVEDVGYQRSMIDLLKAKGIVANPIKHGGRSKRARISSLQPLFEDGRVFVAKGHTEFIAELLEFPNGSHDDRIDAFEMAISQGQKRDRMKIDFLEVRKA